MIAPDLTSSRTSTTMVAAASSGSHSNVIRSLAEMKTGSRFIGGALAELFMRLNTIIPLQNRRQRLGKSTRNLSSKTA